MAHAYVLTNALSGLLTSAFTWSSVPANLNYANDGRMDRRVSYSGNVASGFNVIVDLGSAMALGGWAVLNSNFAVQQDAKLLIEAADNVGMSVNLVTAKALTTLNTAAPKQKDHVLQFATITKRYWRLTWTWTSGNVTNPAVGELFAYLAASVTQLSRKVIYGWGETESVKVATSDFLYGDTQSLFLAGPIRQKNVLLADLSTTDRDQWLALWRATKGPVTPVLWIESFEATATAAAVSEQDCIYGTNVQTDYHWVEGDFALYQPDGFTIRSKGREAGA